MIKKLIEIFKSIFCKQDHTENTVKEDPNVVTLDEVDTIVEESKEECCCCNGECECTCKDEEETDSTLNGTDDNHLLLEEEAVNEELPIEEEVVEDCNEGDTEEDCYIDDGCSFVESELDLWGISADSLGYNCITVIPTLVEKHESYDTLINDLSSLFGRPKGVISTSLKALITKADFAASGYDVLAKINKEDSFKDNVMIIYNWIKSI